MAETKYGKYIISKNSSESAMHPTDGTRGIPVFQIDDSVLNGAFYFECAWFPGNIPEIEPEKPHRHDFDELIGFFGSNPNKPYDLGGQMEFWFDDEKHVIDYSCLIFVPKGIWHTPHHPTNVTSHIFCLSASPSQSYKMKT